MRKRVLQKIINRVGGQTALGAELGVDQRTVSWWLNHGVPPKWVLKVITVDKSFGGNTKAIQLRPDIFGTSA